jgi:hypothetical protein
MGVAIRNHASIRTEERNEGAKNPLSLGDLKEFRRRRRNNKRIKKNHP